MFKLIIKLYIYIIDLMNKLKFYQSIKLIKLLNKRIWNGFPLFVKTILTNLIKSQNKLKVKNLMTYSMRCYSNLTSIRKRKRRRKNGKLLMSKTQCLKFIK